MKIAVTGATSVIGEEVCRQALASGHEVVRLVPRPSLAQDKFFDLDETPAPQLLQGADAVVHLAWKWSNPGGDYRRTNVEGSRKLLDICEANSVRVVLLSTFSAFSTRPSAYADCKRALEYDVQGLAGSVVRAGLIWGGQLAGMTRTVVRLAQVPGVCPHLRPDPDLYQSAQAAVARVLVSASADSKQAGPILAANPDSMRLSRIVHEIRGESRAPHVSLPVSPIRSAAKLAEKSGWTLPLRSDSLGGSLGPGDVPESAWNPDVAAKFPENAEFLNWLRSAAWTREEGGNP